MKRGWLRMALAALAASMLSSNMTVAGASPAIDTDRHLEVAKPYLPIVQRWAEEFDLPQALLLAVIYTESRFDPKARSAANAIGLMQIVPEHAGADAWAYLNGDRRVPSEQELLDPETNIRLGAAYLRMLRDHYWSEITDPEAVQALVLASYNWGVGNVKRRVDDPHKLDGSTLRRLIKRIAPSETAGYLRLVLQRVETYKAVLVSGAAGQLAAN